MNLLFVTQSAQLDVPENHLAGYIIGDPSVEAADSTTDEDALQYKLGGMTDPFFDYRRRGIDMDCCFFLVCWWFETSLNMEA